MPVFSYRAINDDNKEVHGEIDSADLTTATEALKERNLEVVELHEASRAKKNEPSPETRAPELRTTFAFEGTDAAGTVRRGTIQSESKYQAFERLKQDQKLLVSMLSPLGVTPQFRDNDLENWQKSDMKPVPLKPTSGIPQPASPAAAAPKVANPPAKTIGFSSPNTALKTAAVKQPLKLADGTKGTYHPLSSTLRLYAGWLLAWYGLFVALGYYAHVRALPWELPFVEAFFLSPLIFTFIVAIFLFLFLASIQRFLHGKLITGIFLTVIGIAAVAGVRISVQ